MLLTILNCKEAIRGICLCLKNLVQVRVTMLLTASSVWMSQQHILNETPLNRNMYKRRLSTDLLKCWSQRCIGSQYYQPFPQRPMIQFQLQFYET